MREKIFKVKKDKLKRQWQYQSMIIPGIIFLLIFSYIPLYGIIASFKDFKVNLGFFGSPWATNDAGQLDLFKYFRMFLTDPKLGLVLKNTLAINIISLVVGFPAPIIFALFLDELKSSKFKKVVQSITYLPHFVSWIIFGGLVIKLLMPETGAINVLLTSLGLIKEETFLMNRPEYFWAIAVISSIVKGLGWGTIIYLAALTSVSTDLMEYAYLEGANRFQRIVNVKIPSILGTVMIYLIFAVSGILGSSFDQIWILQNDLNVDASEVIATYVYKVGIIGMQVSYSTAVGLLQSVIAFILLTIANFTSKKLTEQGLF